MSSTFPADPRARTTLRWGGAIAALLVVQSLTLAGLFWLLANGSHRRTAETMFAADCHTLAALSDTERHATLRRMIAQDIHRDRFLALFDRNGRLLDGNVAAIPSGVGLAHASTIADVRPTQLPGKSVDTARLVLCAMPDGDRLLTGVDLDEAEEAVRVVERSLAFGLIPGLLLAIGFGLVAGRRAARQVDAVRRLTARIIAGDLDERLPIGSDPPDSFALLCRHINAMLDRLAMLVDDVRGVGDDIAHQIRTPLTRLSTRIERALGQATDRAGFQAAATDAIAEVDKLLGIVAALLRIRELGDHERRSRFAEVDLARLADDACDLYRPTAEDAGVTLECRIGPVSPVCGDASLLIEAIANLLDNAIKFGPTGGTVVLHLADVAGMPVVTIVDEGGGIPAAERRLVTQRFYRGRHDCEGVGLGLSLVHAIAELHGFTLRFANHGSAVSLICGSDVGG